MAFVLQAGQLLTGHFTGFAAAPFRRPIRPELLSVTATAETAAQAAMDALLAVWTPYDGLSDFEDLSSRRTHTGAADGLLPRRITGTYMKSPTRGCIAVVLTYRNDT